MEDANGQYKIHRVNIQIDIGCCLWSLPPSLCAWEKGFVSQKLQELSCPTWADSCWSHRFAGCHSVYLQSKATAGQKPDSSPLKVPAGGRGLRIEGVGSSCRHGKHMSEKDFKKWQQLGKCHPAALLRVRACVCVRVRACLVFSLFTENNFKVRSSSHLL